MADAPGGGDGTGGLGARRRLCGRWPSLLVVAALCGGCAHAPPAGPLGSVVLPLQTAWFEGRLVRYVTTDVSDAAVARAKGANFVPRLSLLLQARPPGTSAAPVERVYAIEGFVQPTVFPSIPRPVGADSRDAAYSPLWRMVRVVWQTGQTARELRSEEQVLEAEDRGQVRLVVTDVILNCPVVAVDGEQPLRGARVEPVPSWR